MKHKSKVVTSSTVVGTSGIQGVLKSVTICSNGAAAGTALIYDGTGTSGTLKYALTCTATAGDSASSPPLSIYCADGIYCVLTTATYITVEYDGC